MAVSEDKTRTIISLEKDLKAKLESLAKQEDRSFNNYVVKILKDYVQSLERRWKTINKFYIYLITNDVNDKVYVGQTTKPIQERFIEHCSSPSKLGKAIQSIGKEHFKYNYLMPNQQTLMN